MIREVVFGNQPTTGGTQMSTKLVKDASGGKKRGPVVLEIPLDQLLPDPYQPRVKFKQQALKELAESIKSQGLQQLPTVHFAYHAGGRDYYYIHAGERRYRAYKILGKAAMLCVVEEGAYDGKRSVKRRLAQGAENFSREPQTHSEIIALVEDVIKEEVEKRGVRYGSVQIALQIVSRAFGKSLGWATNYQTLTGLLPELRDMLDENAEGGRLNFGVGMALARAPADVQKQLLRDAEPYFRKGGHAAGYRFIVRKCREIRESRGEKVRDSRSDDKDRLTRTAERLRKLGDDFCGDLRHTEYENWMGSLLAEMQTSTIEVALSNIRSGLQFFTQMRNRLETQLEAQKKNRARLSIVMVNKLP
jgi:ParB/RepB/Spo0J family partition protein